MVKFTSNQNVGMKRKTLVVVTFLFCGGNYGPFSTIIRGNQISILIMASTLPYIIVEFSDGSVSTVLEKWFTPEKTQVYWPPYSSKLMFNRALARNEEVNDTTWSLYPVKRCLYKSDNLKKAQQKERQAEEISNLDSSGDELVVRKKTRPSRFCDSDDSEQDYQSNKHQRPPKINFNGTAKKNRANSVSQSAIDKIIPDRAESFIQESFGQCSQSETGLLSNILPERTLNNSITEIPLVSNSQKNDIASWLRLLIKIKEQNTQIIKLLSHRGFEVENTGEIEDSILYKLPVTSIESLVSLDNELKEDKVKLSALVSYLSSLGGDAVVTRTNRILKSLMTNSLAAKLNFQGRNKQAFSVFKLKDIIIEIVKSKIKSSETCDIEAAIKNWLKHAPQREKISTKDKSL